MAGSARVAPQTATDLFELPSLSQERLLALVDKRDAATRYEAESIMRIRAFLDVSPIFRGALKLSAEHRQWP